MKHFQLYPNPRAANYGKEIVSVLGVGIDEDDKVFYLIVGGSQRGDGADPRWVNSSECDIATVPAG